MIGQELQRRVGEDEVRPILGRPMGDVLLDELGFRRADSRRAPASRPKCRGQWFGREETCAAAVRRCCPVRSPDRRRDRPRRAERRPKDRAPRASARPRTCCRGSGSSRSSAWFRRGSVTTPVSRRRNMESSARGSTVERGLGQGRCRGETHEKPEKAHAEDHTQDKHRGAPIEKAEVGDRRSRTKADEPPAAPKMTEPPIRRASIAFASAGEAVRPTGSRRAGPRCGRRRRRPRPRRP